MRSSRARFAAGSFGAGLGGAGRIRREPSRCRDRPVWPARASWCPGCAQRQVVSCRQRDKGRSRRSRLAVRTRRPPPRRAPGTAVAGTRIGTESPPRTAARPAAGKPGRWTNPAACARRSALEADFSCLRSAYRGAGYLPRRGGCRSTPQRIRQLDQQVKRCPAGLGARLRAKALPCYKSWPRDEARVNVLTRETSIGKPNRRSARCRYEETTFRSPCVPGRSGPARGVPSSSRSVPGLPSVPCDSSAAASPNSRPRRSGGVNATTTLGMVQEAIMHKRFKNLRAARGRPATGSPPSRPGAGGEREPGASPAAPGGGRAPRRGRTGPRSSTRTSASARGIAAEFVRTGESAGGRFAARRRVPAGRGPAVSIPKPLLHMQHAPRRARAFGCRGPTPR